MDLRPKIEAVQIELQRRGLYTGEIDGLAYGKTWDAISVALGLESTESYHRGLGSSFADPTDVNSFRKWLAIYMEDGLSQEEAEQKAFKKGDNAVGCWGDDTGEGSGPSCALPPDDMIERWGSVSAAKHKMVEVKRGDKTVQCVLKDRMPWKKNITNEAIIDLNPDTVMALGLTPPIMTTIEWKWA